MAENCHQCKFFRTYSEDIRKSLGYDEEQGDCTRRAPVIKQGSGQWGHFPVVDDTVWCGEFKSKNELDKAIDTMASNGALEEKPYGHIEE